MFQVDLDKIRQAWPKIVEYLKENKNFYHVYEEIIKMDPPSKLLQQQSIFAVKTEPIERDDEASDKVKKL